MKRTRGKHEHCVRHPDPSRPWHRQEAQSCTGVCWFARSAGGDIHRRERIERAKRAIYLEVAQRPYLKALEPPAPPVVY